MGSAVALLSLFSRLSSLSCALLPVRGSRVWGPERGAARALFSPQATWGSSPQAVRPAGRSSPQTVPARRLLPGWCGQTGVLPAACGARSSLPQVLLWSADLSSCALSSSSLCVSLCGPQALPGRYWTRARDSEARDSSSESEREGATTNCQRRETTTGGQIYQRATTLRRRNDCPMAERGELGNGAHQKSGVTSAEVRAQMMQIDGRLSHGIDPVERERLEV